MARSRQAERAALAVLATMACVVGACFDPTVPSPIRCGPLGECPSDLVCAAGVDENDPRLCVTGGCNGVETIGESPCVVDGADGLCVQGECHPRGCGDGLRDYEVVDPDGPGPEPSREEGEACDDGNTAGADGCAATCAKVETCGDGFIDSYYVDVDDAPRNIGEACDDANQIDYDGCTNDCRVNAWHATALTRPDAIEVTMRTTFVDGDADPCGTLYLSDFDNHRIIAVDQPAEAGVARPPQCPAAPAAAVARVVLGDGFPLAGRANGDGGPAVEAQAKHPRGLAVAPTGEVYFIDSFDYAYLDDDIGDASRWYAIRRIDRSGYVETAHLLTFQPEALAVDARGTLYVTSLELERLQVLRIVEGGPPEVVVGTGEFGNTGDGGPATAARLGVVRDLVIDGDNLYLVDSQFHRIRHVDLASGVISAFAGTGAPGYLDAEAALTAQFSRPFDVALARDMDDACWLYVADAGNHRVRRVSCAGGPVETVAGNGVSGNNYVDGNALESVVEDPRVVVAEPTRFAVASNRRALSTVTFAPPDAPANPAALAITVPLSLGIEGSLATSAPAPSSASEGVFKYVRRVTVDPTGRTITTIPGSHRVVRIESDGTVTPLAGTGVAGRSPDGDPAKDTALYQPMGVESAGDGTLYIAEALNHKVRAVAPGGIMSTVLGNGDDGALSGGFGAVGRFVAPAALALSRPTSLAMDTEGGLWVAEAPADPAASRLWHLAAPGAPDALAEQIFADDSGRQCEIPPPCPPRPFGEVDGHDAATTVAGSGFTVVAVGEDGSAYVGSSTWARVSCVSPDRRFFDLHDVFSGNGGDVDGLLIESVDSILVSSSSYGLQRVRTADAQPLCGADAGVRIVEQLLAPGQLADVEAGPLEPLSSVNIVRVDDGYLIANEAGVRKVSPSFDAADEPWVTPLAGSIDPLGLGRMGDARLAGPVALALGDPAFHPPVLIAGGLSRTVQAIGDDQVARAVAGYYRRPTPSPPPPGLARFLDGATIGTIDGLALVPGEPAFWITANRVRNGGDTTLRRVDMMPSLDDPTRWTIEDVERSGDELVEPFGLAYDPTREALLIADRAGHAIRALDSSGAVTTLVNTSGLPGVVAEDLAATDGQLYLPRAVLRCAHDNVIYIADTGNHRVLAIRDNPEPTPDTLEIVLGIGFRGQNASGPTAREVAIASPRGLACDSRGLYVTSEANVVMVERGEDDQVDGDAPAYVIYGDVLDPGFPEGQTRSLAGIAVYPDGRIWAADAGTGTLVEITLTSE